MCRFVVTSLTAFPAFGSGRPPQQSFGDFPEFTHVTACWFAARPSRTFVRGASTGRLPAPIVPVATQANRQFLRRDFHSQDTDTFHGAPERLRYRIILSADGAYANNILLSSLPLNVDLVSRMQKNATLHALPKKERRRRRGRPRKKGDKLPKLSQIAEECSNPWISAELKQYGKSRKRLVKAFRCLWYRVAKTRPILAVIVRDPEGMEEDQYFFTTNLQLPPCEVAELMAARWTIETAFWESKAVLGLEDNRCWVKNSVSRVAPFVFLVQSVLKIWFCQCGHNSRYFSLATAEWYQKENPTFSDMLNTLRVELLALEISRTSMSRYMKRKIVRLLSNIAWAA